MSDDNQILRQIESGEPVGIINRNVKVVVTFYTHAIKDEVASKREGRTIYKNVDYVQRKAIGDKDFISAPVQLSDQDNYPQEWAAYQAWKLNPKTHVRTLPRMTPAHFRLCEDLQIPTIQDLAVTEVPPELEELKQIAIAWLRFEKGEPEVKKGGRPKGSKNRPKNEDAKAAA